MNLPTNDEINAGFDVMLPALRTFIRHHVPSMFENQALEVLNSKDSRKDMVNMVRDVLLAAGKVRAGE